MTVGRLSLLAKAAEHPEVAERWVLPPALPLLQLVGFVAGGQMFRGYQG